MRELKEAGAEVAVDAEPIVLDGHEKLVEVQAQRETADQLKKLDWVISVYPSSSMDLF